MVSTPAIMVIRHAEKPEDDSSLTLSERGWQRAGALVRWLAPVAADAAPMPPLRRPTRIVAAASTPAHPSTRPHDTVLPLAQLLEIPIEQAFGSDDDAPRAAAWLHSADEAVLVCWRHDTLPALARALLPPERASLVPASWPDDRFDLMWSVHVKHGEWTLTQVPQQLLAGDRANGVVRRVAGSHIRRATASLRSANSKTVLAGR